MALTLAGVRERLEHEVQKAHDAGDDAWREALQPIASQLHMIEGAKTMEEQKAGCQHLSHSILVVQMLHPNRQLADSLNDLRVAIGQFACMGREAE